MKELGIKKLDKNNWLEPDKLMSAFKKVHPDNNLEEISANEWFDNIYKPKLEDSVPIEIHKLFEVARGTMVYGYFFYPIFSFSAEQFTRIAESTISFVCTILNSPKSVKTFSEKVKWLAERPEFKNMLFTQWESLRKLRNTFSHPSKQTIVTPFMVIELMSKVADDINYIFNSALTSNSKPTASSTRS